MIQKVSKRHHYIPQTILKRFCYKDSKLFYYKRGGIPDCIVSRDITGVFLERNYYNTLTRDGRRSDEVEKSFYGPIDQGVSNFIDHVEGQLGRGETPSLSIAMANFVRQFLFNYTRRTPDSISNNTIVVNPRTAIEELLATAPPHLEGVISKFKEQLTTEKVEEIIHTARIFGQIRPDPQISETMCGMKLIFGVAPIGKQFIIGGKPVLRFENRVGAVLGDGVELWTPFSKNFAIGLIDGNANTASKVTFSEVFLRKFNEQMFAESKEIASGNQKLIESMSDRKYDLHS